MIMSNYVAVGYVASGYVSTNDPPIPGYPDPQDVKLGVVYGPANEYTGTYVTATAADIASAVWGSMLVNYTTAGSFGAELSTQADVAAVWDERLVDHTTVGTFGGDLATHSDIQAAAATVAFSYTSGSIIGGTLTSGTIANTVVRDGNYWVIKESATTGLTVEYVFNLDSVDQRAGAFNLFGRYDGKGSSHYLELWAWNVEGAAWELLHEDFIRSTTQDEEFTHGYYEQHIDRATNEVKIRLVHNVTTYHATHELHIDSCWITAISVVTAADIANAIRTDLTPELTQITKVSKIHGIGVNLVVSPTTRTAGDLVQTISTVGSTTTVSAV